MEKTVPELIAAITPEEWEQGEHPTFYSIERGKSYVLVQGLSNLSPKGSR